MLPTTAAQIEYREDELEIREFAAVGVDPATLEESQAFEIESGGLDGFGTGSVLLSKHTDETFRVKTDERVTLHLANMTTLDVTVAGIYANGLGFANVVFAKDDVVAHGATLLADTVYVDVVTGADADEVAGHISALVEDGYQLEVVQRDTDVKSVKQGLVDGAWVTYLIIGSAALFAGLSLVNTMKMSTAERAREFALMRLIGATDRQILSMIGGDSLIVLAIGALTDVGIGGVSMFSVSLGLTSELSAVTVPILSLILLATAVSLMSYVVPARFALRVDPISQAGSK